MGLEARKPAFGGSGTTKAQTSLCICSLISAFVVRLLESIISQLATREISLFKLVSVAEETGLSLNLLESQKTGFHTARLISCHM